jgi:surface protein
MNGMFAGCQNFNVNLSNWNTRNVTNMNSMFAGCQKLKVDLSDWDTTNVVTMERMFYFTDMPGHFKPHLKSRTHSDDFDVVILVLMHGNTTTSCPTNHEPNFANATLLEATPCGVINFCMEHSEPGAIVKYVRKNIKNPAFVSDLQEYLRTVKKKNIENADIDEKSKSDYQWYIRERGWQILTNGYMDRDYSPDSDKTSVIRHILVCYAKNQFGAFMENEGLNQSYKISSRTDLMHLLKDSGYGKPLIIDLSCGGFLDEKEDTELQRLIDLGRRIKVAGTRRRKMKRKRTK